MASLERRPGHLEQLRLQDFDTTAVEGGTYQLEDAGPGIEFFGGPDAWNDEEEEEEEDEWGPYPGVPPQPPLPVDKLQRDYFDYLHAENPGDPLPGFQLLRSGGLRRILQLNKDSLRELELIRCNDLLRDQAVVWMLPVLQNLERLTITVTVKRHFTAGLTDDALNCLSSLTKPRQLSLGADPYYPEEDHREGGDVTIFAPSWQPLTGIWELTQLTSLHLQSHGLQNFPRAISKLSQLQILELEACGYWMQQGYLQPAIGSLVSLRRLSLRATPFYVDRGADYCLGNLANLAVLDISQCIIDYVPEFVNRLTALRELNMLRAGTESFDDEDQYAYEKMHPAMPGDYQGEEGPNRQFLPGCMNLAPLTRLQKLCLSGIHTPLRVVHINPSINGAPGHPPGWGTVS
ncbi:hypothetical protein WJX72_001663 [[Myrmecia] bisecta]|uniref:Uncharacterized protein n=1 Tax=[Myrmecia] bisecta TaxID=41462 RepID=A0AAW1R5D6_9CHLO